MLKFLLAAFFALALQQEASADGHGNARNSTVCNECATGFDANGGCEAAYGSNEQMAAIPDGCA